MNKPDIVPILVREGMELKQKGKNLWGLCLLHSEKMPSFKVDPERQSFYCFGCHEHGDVIDFIRKYRSLSFKEALSYLGINGKPSKKTVYKTLRDKHTRELINQFRRRCNEYFDDICSLYRSLQKAKAKAKTMEDVEALAEFYHLEPVWLHRIKILQGNDEQEKLNLYRELVYGS